MYIQQFTQAVGTNEQKEDIKKFHYLTGQWAFNASPEPDKYVKWEMYDDITCLMLELALTCYAKGMAQSKIIPINSNYCADFSKLIQYNANDPTKQRKIKRVKNLDQKRPEWQQRFNSKIYYQILQNKEQSSSNWLAENWILQNKSFNNGQFKMPTVNQIKQGFIEEGYKQQVQQINFPNINQDWIKKYVQTIEILFNQFKIKNFDEPIEFSDFMDPKSPIVKLILSLNSIESFFGYQINNAEIQKDHSKIQNLGAYAFCLCHILYYSLNKTQQNDNCWRGSKLSQKEILDLLKAKESRKIIKLEGYTSTISDKSKAIEMSQFNCNRNYFQQQNVLFQINLKGDGYFKLNDPEYSLYSKQEAEILLGNDNYFEIEEIKEEKYLIFDQQIEYTLIKLNQVIQL